MLRGRKFTERHFCDTLQIGTSSGGTANSWGNTPDSTTWTYDSVNTVACFVDAATRGEAQDGGNITLTDAVIYVPSGTAVTELQRVKVTHRYRAALSTAEVYAVIGAPKNGRNCLVLNCKRVIGESKS